MTNCLVKCTTVNTIAKLKKKFLIACFTSFEINPWGLPYVWLIWIFSPQPSLHPLWKVATLRRRTFVGWFRVLAIGSGNVVVLWPQGLRRTSPTWGNAKVTICTLPLTAFVVILKLSNTLLVSYRVLDKVPVGVVLLYIIKKVKVD